MVFLPGVIQDGLGFDDIEEELAVQVLVPYAAVQGFDHTVLPGLSGLYVEQFHVHLGGPGRQCVGDKFRPVEFLSVVNPNFLRQDAIGTSASSERFAAPFLERSSFFLRAT